MELTVAVGVVGTIAGMVFSYIAFSRTKARDTKDEGRQDGVILTDLGYIKANTDEIKAEQKEQRKINTEVLTRLTKVEASADRAHFRLNHLENQVEHLDTIS